MLRYFFIMAQKTPYARGILANLFIPRPDLRKGRLPSVAYWWRPLVWVYASTYYRGSVKDEKNHKNSYQPVALFSKNTIFILPHSGGWRPNETWRANPRHFLRVFLWEWRRGRRVYRVLNCRQSSKKFCISECLWNNRAVCPTPVWQSSSESVVYISVVSERTERFLFMSSRSTAAWSDYVLICLRIFAYHVLSDGVFRDGISTG